jgi:hypothetical protein
MEFPSVADVAEVLRELKGRVEGSWERVEDEDEDEEGWLDVRLQVEVSGAWGVWSGDACYDTDHSGYWGASSLSAESDVVEVARELLADVRESVAQGGEDEAAGESEGPPDPDPFPRHEHIRTWESEGFRLDVWNTYCRDARGQDYLAYQLTDGGEVVFQGDDFSGSPMHADDSDETVGGLLGFLSLCPGDTDDEYFDSYTVRQLVWCQSGRAERLSGLAMELEEACRE